MFGEATGPRVLGFSMEYSPSQVLTKNERGHGRRKGEGEAGEEKAGKAPEQVGVGRAGEGPGAAVPPGRWLGSSAQMDSAVLAGSIQPTPPQWDGTGRC